MKYLRERWPDLLLAWIALILVALALILVVAAGVELGLHNVVVQVCAR